MNSSLIVTEQDSGLSTDILHGWKQAAASWADNLRSDRTRRAYLQAWASFLTFSQVAPDLVTQDDVIAYRRHLETTSSPKTGKPYSQTTINLHLSALSSFFDWVKGRGLRADNPADGVNRKAVTPYGKATWLDPETGDDLKLLDTVDISTDQGIRDRAILLLFLTHALRVAEVASLTVGSLRRQGKKTFMTYTRKRGKTEEVELASETAEAIDAYLKTRLFLTPTSPLFVATDAGRKVASYLGHEVAYDAPLTTRAIAALVKSYCNRAFGKGHGIHPHSLRHTAAMTAVHLGDSVTDVSDLLGHASLQVTTIYLHATGKGTAKVAAGLGRRYGKKSDRFHGNAQEGPG